MEKKRIRKRLAKDKALLWGVCLLAALTAVPLFAILGEVFLRGYDQLSWSFFTEPTPTAYKAMMAIEAGEPIPGGIANGIIGTLLMLSMAAIFAIPIGILCGAYLAENPKNKFAQIVSYLTDLLQGTPSVIIGIVVYIWVVVPMKGYSAIAGSVALFIMMLPLIIRSTEETLKILPASLKEAGLALGGNRARVMLKVQLPQPSEVSLQVFCWLSRALLARPHHLCSPPSVARLSALPLTSPYQRYLCLSGSSSTTPTYKS